MGFLFCLACCIFSGVCVYGFIKENNALLASLWTISLVTSAIRVIQYF